MSRTPPVRKPKVVEKNRQDRRDFILAQSAELFAKHGYQATTTEMISEATDLNKGTIYYYYPLKADILFDICHSTATRSIEIVEASTCDDAAASLARIIHALIAWFHEKRDYVSVYFHEEYILETVLSAEQFRDIQLVQRRFMKHFYRLLARGAAEGTFATVNITVAARLIVGMVVGSRRWPNAAAGEEEVAAAIVDMVTYGLSPASRRPA